VSWREKEKEKQMSSGRKIRKGPWKEEEDGVLINHVKKYGPRDWSSIRSKSLLHGTGKSCHLCWVNKLRPNLKNEYQINLVNYIFNLLQFYMHVVINYQDFDPGLFSLLFIFSPIQ